MENEEAAPANDSNPMVDFLAQLIKDVADTIESNLMMRPYIERQGGEYKQSLLIAYEKKLHEASVAVISAIVNHPSFQAKGPN
jgi:hypothetical protein